MRKKFINKILGFALLLAFMETALAEVTNGNVPPAKVNNTTISNNPVEARLQREEKVTPNSFAIGLYKPNYLLPFYYTRMPYNSIYRGNTPDNESLKKTEIKYQLSFKVPVWKNIFNYPVSLNAAYSQLSYWQAYNKSAFFRETNYEPEIFLSSELNHHLFKNWRFNIFTLGVVHQSNGLGGTLERSWNRAYMGAVFSSDHWIIGIKPWIIFHDNTYEQQNPDLFKYLGYEEIAIAYKYNNQVISLLTRNMIETGFKRSAAILSWSFPLTTYVKGYVQVFSGYGQSLIEYNHRTNSFGLGVALNDWV